MRIYLSFEPSLGSLAARVLSVIFIFECPGVLLLPIILPAAAPAGQQAPLRGVLSLRQRGSETQLFELVSAGRHRIFGISRNSVEVAHHVPVSSSYFLLK